MKSNHIILFLLIASFLTNTAGAQGKKFTMGIKGGVNLSKLSMGNFLTTRYDGQGNPYLDYDGHTVKDNLQESFDSKTGWSGGIYMRFGSGFYVQPEVLVSTKGGRFDIQQNDGPTPTVKQIDYKFSSIDVPLLFGLKGGPFRVNAGPVAMFKIGNNQKIKDAIRYYTTSPNAMSEAVFGYQVGAGLDIFGLSLDVRREGTLSNINSFQVNTGDNSSTVKQKLKSWQITLGIRLI
ncbi:hypothetical protein GCM10023091_42640 [Ravibacter arvi]|uniref:Outer membrane protein beta-barrel domain-containing protein n=1 Tax=Ravibacter arvi TaxID=2051041 RepID=A0ABP8MDX1_9BACT